MIEAVLTIALILGGLGFAEWKHQKTGNGKRFEQIHQMMNQEKL